MPATYTIFAYGSLINQASLKKTVPEARNMFPASAVGLKRVFKLASSYRFDDSLRLPVCVLSAESGAADSRMNGSCFEMDEMSLDGLLQRESSYDLVRIEAQPYRDCGDSFEAYYFRAKPAEPYQYLLGSSAQKQYLQLCLTGCKVYGQQFVDDFKCSTSFWGIDCEQTLKTIWRGDY